MAIIGVLARVDIGKKQETIDHLGELDGVETFSVEEQGQIGILIERPTFEDAQLTLANEVGFTPGVECAWPVFGHLEEMQ